MNDWEKREIERIHRGYERDKARLDRQHQERLNRMQAATDRYVYNCWLDVIVNNIEAGVKPDASLKKDVKKAGIDFESLYRDASRKVFNKRVTDIKKEMYEHLVNDATALREFLNKFYEWDADYTEQIINGVLESMQEDYPVFIDQFIDQKRSSTDYSQSLKYLLVIAGMNNKSVEDVKQDLAERKAEIEEEEKKQREEKERQRIAQNKVAYKKLVKQAIDKMVNNVNEGVEFITKYENISEILSDVKVSLDDCINKAKAQADNQRINSVKYDVKNAYKERNKVGYYGLGCFAIGLLFLSPFFLIIGACLLGITYFRHTKAEKVRKNLGTLVAIRDGVEYDPSVNPYELPIVAKIINLAKGKKNIK